MAVTVTMLAMKIAGRPGLWRSAPIGTSALSLPAPGTLRADLISSATTRLTAASPRPMVKSGPVGGSAAEPPSQPTTSGPAPWPIAAAIM